MKFKYQLLYRVTFSCVLFRNHSVVMIRLLHIKLLKGIGNGRLLTCLSKNIILFIGPYPYLLFKICKAYADCGRSVLYISCVSGTFVFDYDSFAQYKVYM